MAVRNIRVRGTEPSDAAAISDVMNCPGVIYGTLQLPYRPVAFHEARYREPQADIHSLVAEVDGRVVGAAGLHLASNPRRRHSADIGMAVHDDFQNQGVGSALMEAMIELGERWLGLTRLELTVHADNDRAVHLYQKYGFEIEGTARRYALRDGELADVHVMARLRE